MNFIARRKPLALLFCSAFAGTLVGGFSGEAQAQSSAVLRVDPALLGLPPLKPAKTPDAVKAPQPESAPPTASPSDAEVKPVEPDVVEAKPAVRAPVPERSAERSTASNTAPAEENANRQVPVSETKFPPEPVRVVPDSAPVALSSEPAAAPVGAAPRTQPQKAHPVARPAPTQASTVAGVTSLPLLRVDPALLGAVPTVVASQRHAPGKAGSVPMGSGSAAQSYAVAPTDALAAAAETVPPQVASAGAHDEIREADYPPQTVFLSAYRMNGNVDREFVAEGDVELHRDDTVVNSDSMTYWPIEDEVEAVGKVRLERGGDVVTGPKMRLRLEDEIGYFDQPSYRLKRQPPDAKKAAEDSPEKVLAARITANQSESSWLSSGFVMTQTQVEPTKRKAVDVRGEADRIDFEGENQIRLTNSTYTTCAPGDDAWYAKTSDLKLDYDHEVGDGKDGVVYFKGVPFLYSPWLSFSLNNQRKSGFLAPSVATNSKSGFEFTLPYYWNIAPNMDATISPHVLSKRGLQMKGEFRYLNTALGGGYQGTAQAEFLPGDKLRDGKDRYGFSLQHTQSTANGFSGTINYNKVSDNNYYTDLSSGVASTSTTQLLQQVQLGYGGGGWWNVTANLQQYQTLQPDPENPVQEPYKLLPQITVNARKPDFHMTDSSFLGQYTHFTRSDQFINGAKVFSAANGERTVLYPQVALPYVTPGWYVTPKLGVNVRNYSGLEGHAAGTPGSINVTLPVASIDAGMTFERSSNWFGRDYTQTLEPRLYYLNIPYKDQSQIPLFDTGLADFNFAQIFSENQFSSWDRISNANQLTAAATSRLLDPKNGNEIMRVMLRQRFYFTRNRVALNSTTGTSSDQTWGRSDWLAAFSGQILPKVFADAAVQYNVSDQKFKRYSFGARYKPEPGKTLNAAYRYNRDASAPIDQVDFSGQWPLSGRWYAVGRANYSFKDDGTNLSTSSQGGRLIESIAGLEYNGGCWVLRGVFQRVVLTQATATTSFFIQLELNDFARVGSNPLSLLKRNIQGYSQINQMEDDPVYGE